MSETTEALPPAEEAGPVVAGESALVEAEPAGDEEGEEVGDEEEEYEDEDEDGGEQYVVLKFLLSTDAAGSIIGKNGITVNELQTQSGTKIQLSKARDYFPGTTERMMLLCGSMSSVLVALHLVLTKLMADEIPMLSSQPATGEVSQIAMVVPNRLCGGIIGRGGSTINSFMEDSGAQLAVSPIAEALGFGERLIYVKGEREAQLRAVALVATKMSEDRNYRTDEVPLSYPMDAHMYVQAGMQHQMMQQQPHQQMHPHAPAYYGQGEGVDQARHAAHHEANGGSAEASGQEARSDYLLSEEAVGVIIGKQGKTVQNIRQRSGARIKIKESEGSGQRLLSITGPLPAVQSAEAMLMARLQQQGREAALQHIEPGQGASLAEKGDPSAAPEGEAESSADGTAVLEGAVEALKIDG